MNLTINFNWPTGEDSASVEVSQPNVNDADTEFRVGVIPKEHSGKIAWHNSGWGVGDRDMERIVFLVKQGDKVLVERRKKGEEKVQTRNEWDINEHWPAEAHDATMTVVPWYF